MIDSQRMRVQTTVLYIHSGVKRGVANQRVARHIKENRPGIESLPAADHYPFSCGRGTYLVHQNTHVGIRPEMNELLLDCCCCPFGCRVFFSSSRWMLKTLHQIPTKSAQVTSPSGLPRSHKLPADTQTWHTRSQQSYLLLV